MMTVIEAADAGATMAYKTSTLKRKIRGVPSGGRREAI